MLAREWRAGELGVLLLALTIAVGALSGVGFLVSRVRAAVALQATEVLAADLRLESPQPIPAADFTEAAREGLRSARAVGMLSVVFDGERSQLADVYAVTDGYPLRGRVRVASQSFAPGTAATGIPPRGVVWPDSRLLSALGAQVGARLAIGSAGFTVGRVLISRPDQGSTFTGLVPSLLMNAADLPRTQLIQPGSRVHYSALFAGPAGRVRVFRAWLQAHLGSGERLRTIAEASRHNAHGALLASTAALSLLVVVVNRGFWRRLYRLAETRYTLLS